MQKIVLTGNIGAGKSTIANIFKKNDIQLFDADKIIQEIYTTNTEFKQSIYAINPNFIEDDTISKTKIIDYLHENPHFLSTLEALLYPILDIYRREFIDKYQHESLILFEVPLLFEKNLQDFYDIIILIYAPYETRLQRALKRPNMTQEKFNLINNQQTPYQEILDKVDIAIDTTQSLLECEKIIINNFFKI